MWKRELNISIWVKNQKTWLKKQRLLKKDFIVRAKIVVEVSYCKQSTQDLERFAITYPVEWVVT